jgi:protein-L-isoaspartate(D-aspartate) O-methyltransferase
VTRGRRVLAAVLTAVVAGCTANSPEPEVEVDGPDSFEVERERMVREQIAARGIEDQRVLDAMLAVPRHEFVPEDQRRFAYEDRPLPIGYGQTISQPYVVAFMTEQLDLDGSERVLEVGTGSGYQAAVLGRLAREVYSIEIVKPLAERAAEDLKRLGYDNVHVRAGDGYRGWPEHAPFDAIVVTAAPDHVPPPLVDQLAEGGRLVVPVGTWSQDLVLLTRDADGIHEQHLIGVRFVPMTGEAEK